MSYRCYLPSAPLSNFVRCYWTFCSDKAQLGRKFHIVPDGCANLIVCLRGRYRQYDADGRSFLQPKRFVIGQLTRPLLIEPVGDTQIFAVRFLPYGLAPLITLPLNTLQDCALPITQVLALGEDELSGIESLADTETQIAQMEQMLIRLAVGRQVNGVAKGAVDAIMTGSYVDVETLCQSHHLQRRKLERLFAQEIGISPKQFMSILRVQSTLWNLLDEPDRAFEYLDGVNDYYDQAHFIKSFKRLTQLTPSAFGHDEIQKKLFYVR